MNKGECINLTIYIDNRGSGEKEIADILISKHYPVVVQHIDSGDFVIGEMGVERKTVSDLLNSLIPKVEQKGHPFWEQIKVMKDTYKKQLVIVEGYIDWADRRLVGSLLALVDGWQIPFLNTSGKDSTAERIGQLHDRYGSAKTSQQPPIAVRKGYTDTQIRVSMLTVIPHLGTVTAKRIVEKNPKIFADTSKAYDLNIQGLHKDSKDTLLKVLCQ